MMQPFSLTYGLFRRKSKVKIGLVLKQLKGLCGKYILFMLYFRDMKRVYSRYKTMNINILVLFMYAILVLKVFYETLLDQLCTPHL